MIQVFINGVDKTKYIQAGSIQIDNVLTRKVDTCSFDLLNRDSDPYTPIIGQEVIVYLSSTKVFGGVITALNEKAEAYKLLSYTVSCADYTRILDRRLVPDTYENMTVDAIIADLKTNYMPADFTIANVNCPIVIKYIAFNYIPVSKCLEQLAGYTGYDFYIDYDKDVHFFDAQNTTAPVDIQDDNGTYIYDSLVIRKDNSQVRNSIIVRGGEYLGSTFTTEILTNGTDTIFPLAYKYNDFKATLTGQSLNLGVDYIDNPDTHDALYNFQEKIIRFRDSRTPSAGSTLRVSGQPYLPVIVKVKSPIDIGTMSSMEGGDGVYEYLIVDKSIDSKEGARQRAYAEIKTYATTLSEGEFITLTDGLRAGMKIRINSTTRNIDEYFVINKVTLGQFGHDSFVYKISLVTTKTFDLIDLLAQLLLAETKKIEINSDEIVDLVETLDETATITEAVVISKVHNPQEETATISEVFTAQALDYAVEFVAGPYTPTGTKRVFILNGSRLG